MLLPALLLLAHAGASGVPDTAANGAVYNGRARELDVRVPRIDASIETDGRLDEPAWREAAVLTGFSQFSPADGRPALDSTAVLVWYSATAIHFGVRAHEAHGVVNATLADRDRLGAEDRIEILLGTFDDGRQAYVFGVNPLGVQMDGTLNETGTLRAGGFMDGGAQSREAPDLNPDFVYASKGRLTGSGYEIEISIPFKSLRYQDADAQSWGLNVVRRVQHSGHEDSWAPASRAGASFLGQSGKLVGLSDLRRGLVLDLNPEVTQRMDGARDGAAFDREMGDVQVGGNVRWGITTNLTLNGTVRPDFSQVEADAGQFTFDPRQALFFPEKRPFFLEASELFSTPSNLVYTRRIVQPVAAAKLTGKVSGTSIALLSAVDDRSGSLDADPTNPVFNILRVQRDLGRQSRLGATYTDRIDGSGFNRVASIDGRVVFREIYSTRFQVAGALDRVNDVDRDGSLWNVRFDRNGRAFGLSYALSGIDPDFRTRSGFIGRPGIASARMIHRYTWYAPQGAFWQSVTPDVTLDGTWQYDSFTRRGDMQDKKLHLNVNGVLRGGWGLGAAYLVESFGYDPALYSRYYVELPDGSGDIVPFTGTPRLPNHDWVLNVATPEWKRFSGSIFYLWGQDENFFEWAPADIVYATLAADWRPTDQLRVNAQYQHQEFDRLGDNSTVGVRRIPRLKVEYQIARPVFVRVIGEYDASRTDALRDDSRTGGRLMTYDPETDTYAPVLGVRENRFRLDWLFSYQPTPGTVFFAGYGSLMEEPEALRFGRRMERVTDGFFVKMSYLFRM